MWKKAAAHSNSAIERDTWGKEQSIPNQQQRVSVERGKGNAFLPVHQQQVRYLSGHTKIGQLNTAIACKQHVGSLSFVSERMSGECHGALVAGFKAAKTIQTTLISR